jgi:hypothetical protein
VKYLLVLALLAGGCRDRSRPVEPTVEPPLLGSGSGSAPVSMPTQAPPEPPKGATITLPKGPVPRTQPAKTTAKLPAAMFEKLSQLDYDSFTKRVRRIDDKGVELVYTTKSRPFISAAVAVDHCFDCAKMDLDTWKAKTDALKAHIPLEIRDKPGVQFEVGATDLAGAPMIFTYQLGAVGAKGSGDLTYTNVYILYYNDGVNQIRVNAAYADDIPKDPTAITRVVPREDLETVAKAFMDAFTHAWTTS